MSNDSNEHDAQHDDDGSLNDEVVGLLDCVDTEVGTGELCVVGAC